MLILTRLGARLALAGGIGRSALVLAGNMIGTILIVATFAVPRAMTTGNQTLEKDEKTLVVVIAVFLLVPVVVLLMAVGRLSAGVRDRRLAALRLLGVTSTGTRLVAAVENGVLAAAGAALGVAAFVSLAPIADQQIANGPGWFVAPLRPGLLGGVLSWLIVVAASVTVSLAPTGGLGRNPLQARRPGPSKRPNLLRLVPVAIGAAYLIWVIRHPYGQAFGPSNNAVYRVLIASAVAAIGVPIAIPVLIRLAADALVTLGRTPTTTLAGRRMQVEPAAATRLITGITVAILLITGAAGVVVSWQLTPQYRDAQLALTIGPQWSDAFNASPAVVADLATTPGVEGVAPVRLANTACSATLGPKYASTDSPCLNGLVATCRQMEIVLHVTAPDCVDGTVLQIRGSEVNEPGLLDQPFAFYRSDRQHPDRKNRHVTVTPTATTTVLEPAGRYADTADILIPPDTPGIDAVTGKTDHWIYQLDGGYPPRDALLARAQQLSSDYFIYNEDINDYQAVKGYRLIIWTLTAIVLTVGFAALAITAIDRAQERRTWITAQLALGVPLAVLRRAQLMQTLLPLTIGLVGAFAVGALGGTAFLVLDGLSGETTPWHDITRIAYLCICAILATAIATLPALGRRLNPRYLHQE